MLPLLVQLWQVVQIGDDAVDPGADEAGGAQFLEDVQVLALARFHHRRQQHQPGALGQRQYRIHHLAHGLGAQALPVFGAARFADAGIQQAQVVVDFGNGTDGGAWIVRGGLLFDGNCR